MNRFLIINPFGIGDVLFTTPLVRALRQNYPDSFIGYWCNERVAPILKANPNINTVIALSRGDLKKIFHRSTLEGLGRLVSLFKEIVSGKFDIAFDFSLDHRYVLAEKLFGIKKRIGFNFRKRGMFLTHRINIDGYSLKHMVEFYTQLLQFLNIKPVDLGLELKITEDQRIRNKILLSYSGIRESDLVVGIAPGAGASWGKDAGLKHWPALKFAQLGDRIANELGAKIILLGDEQERPIADIISGAMKNKPLDFVGKTSLEGLVALIQSLRLLVTNDGGPLHMAAALGIKSVSIFGPVDELVYGPYPPSANHVVIKRDIPCRPCYRNFKFWGCDNDRACIKPIGVDEVFEAVRRIW